MAKRRVGGRLEAKLKAMDDWLAAIRRTDTEAARRAAAEGRRSCSAKADPFLGVFGSLEHIAARLWLGDQVVQGRVERCSFCLRLSSDGDIEKVIGGAQAFICSLCIDAAAATDRSSATPLVVECQFCGQKRDAGVYQRLHGAICRECVDLCVQLMSEVRQGVPEWQ